MTRKKSVPRSVSAYMAEIGAKGGKKGRGVKKTRDADHYRRLVAIRHKNRETRLKNNA